MEAPVLAVAIDLDSTVPVHRQISDGIRRLLVARSLLPGTNLPPVRQLAIDLAVHFNTVAEAYRTLAEEGWLDLRRGRGAQVIERPEPAQAPPEVEVRLTRRLSELVAAAQAEGVRTAYIAQELRRIAEELEPCSTRG